MSKKMALTCIYFDNKGLQNCFSDVKQRATKRKQKA